MTDERLLKRARRGDEAAFGLLYERHRDLVFRFAYRLLQSPEIAEEITHDCFISLLEAPRRFAPDAQRASLRTYLCAIARNLAFKRLRGVDHESPLEQWSENLAAPDAVGPLQLVLAAEISEAVRKAVVALPLLQREALILFEYEDLSLAEIAEVAGVDVNTIKSRLHRARESLRRALALYGDQRKKARLEAKCL